MSPEVLILLIEEVVEDEPVDDDEPIDEEEPADEEKEDEDYDKELDDDDDSQTDKDTKSGGKGGLIAKIKFIWNKLNEDTDNMIDDMTKK